MNIASSQAAPSHGRKWRRWAPSPWQAAVVVAIGLSALWLPVQAQEVGECSLTVNTAVVDFGRVNRDVLTAPSGEASLGRRPLTLTLTCPQDRDLTVHYRAVATGLERFRLSEGNEASYTLNASEAVLDGEAVSLGVVAADGEPPTVIAPRLPWRPGEGLVPIRGGVPAQGRSLSMHLVVEGWARADSLQVRDQAEWESDGLLEAVAVSARHDLAVEANLVPAACNPTIVGGSTIDYGRISAAELEDAAETTLPGNRSFDLSVSCDAATQFAVRATDNRAGSRSAMDGVSFGLGTAAGGERIGYFRLNVQTAGSAIDALPPSKALLSMDGGLTWVHEDNIGLRNDGTGWVGLSKSVGETTPSMATHAVFHIAIDTKIAPRETLPTTGEINLDGNVTLEVFTL